jgi:UDP-2-acetamido-3-amino-2,3-dideoxy-glucuronate N-acetyltransferase
VRVWERLGVLRVVCDPDQARLAEVKAEHGELEVAGDAAFVLARPDVDAVVVATPAATHAALALQALEAGKDVLVEKPMATTVADGARLVEAARRLGRVLAVGHLLEHHPAVDALAALVRSGTLGRVRYLAAHRLNLGRIRGGENALWSLAPHDIALLLRLLGREPDEVSCFPGGELQPGVVDSAVTTLRFPGGVRAHTFASWLHPFKEHRFVVAGDEGMAVFDDAAAWPGKLLHYPHRVDWVEGQVPVARRAEARRVPLEPGEPLERQARAFLDSVRTRQPARNDGRSGLAVLRVLDAAQRSLDAGGLPQPMTAVHAGAQVHPTAVVDPGAVLGAGTRVWHFSHVSAGARVGEGCVLGQNVFVGRGVRIGPGVKVQNNVSVYEGVELEDHVFCGPSVVFTNVRDPRSEIDRRAEFRATRVRRGATLGANATIVCGVTIGRYAFVGAGAVVTRDVADHALVVGVPAEVAGWVCECGARLALGDGGGECEGCAKAYVPAGDGGLRRA